MSAATTDSKPVRREVGPSWVVVARLTRAVHVALVIALLLVTTRHVLAIRVGGAVDAGVVLLTVALALLVSWPRHGPRA